MTGRRSESPPAVRDRRGPTVALVDTNVLLLVSRRRFPLAELAESGRYGRLELRIPEGVLRELAALVRRGTPGARTAQLLAQRWPIVRHDGTGDDAIVAVAQHHRCAVVTNDRALAARLRHLGVDTLVPRGRTGLLWRFGERPPTTPRPPRARATVKNQPLVDSSEERR